MSRKNDASRRAAAPYQNFPGLSASAVRPRKYILSAFSALCFYACVQADAYAGQSAYRGSVATDGVAQKSFNASAAELDPVRSTEMTRRESNDQRYGDERDFERFLRD